MSATNYGQNWGSWSSVDSVLNAATVAASATSSPSNAINNFAASPNEVLDTEIDLAITAGVTISGGPITIYILKQTQAGYQATTDPNVYTFTSTLVASTTTHAVFVVPGSDVGSFKIAVGQPATNSTITVSMYSRQSQGQAN